MIGFCLLDECHGEVNCTKMAELFDVQNIAPGVCDGKLADLDSAWNACLDIQARFSCVSPCFPRPPTDMPCVLDVTQTDILTF